MSTVHRLFADPPAAPAPVGDFEAVWKMWPRKDGKAVARAKYLAIIKGGYQSKTLDKSSGQYIGLNLSATEQQILSGAKAFLESQKARGSGAYGYVDGGKWIPHLSTFLGRAGWEDWI